VTNDSDAKARLPELGEAADTVKEFVAYEQADSRLRNLANNLPCKLLSW
jgi:hypothetical protein